MKNIIMSIPIMLLLLAFSCKKDSQSPTSVDQNKSETVIYALGDTSGYAKHPMWYSYVREPQPIKQVFPQSPEYAKINNIEGMVHVDYCMTKVGIIRGAVITKTDNEIFNKPALEAMLQWEFIPAMGIDSMTIEMWRSNPFRFVNR